MQVLSTITFASLDELQFKRAAISSEVIEVNVKLTLYLAHAPASPARDGDS